MDRGVMGVQVPHINTAEDARRAVAAVKFGPGAGRGLAAGTRPDRWGLGGAMTDFTRAANAQSLVCVQIEHEAALANVDEILTVADIDVFFIGPSDLSQSMGHPGNAKAPPVRPRSRQRSPRSARPAACRACRRRRMRSAGRSLRGSATSTRTCRASLARGRRRI